MPPPRTPDRTRLVNINSLPVNLGRSIRCALLGLTAAVVVSCASTLDGTPVSIYADPFRVAGLPTTSGPNGLRPGAPAPTLTADNADDGAIDTLALSALEDIEAYWKEEYPKYFGDQFEPVDGYLSWDASDRNNREEFCEESTRGVANAAYCPLDRKIAWDRGVLLPAIEEQFSDIAVVMVLAHEYGHAIQDQANLVGNRRDEIIVAEQQADCFGGAFMRHVAEGRAAHFTMNTSDGLNSVLAATVSIRDSDPNSRSAVHGSAFERVTAVQIGFTDGPSACGKIDLSELEMRREDLPQMFEQDESGELPPTEDTLESFTKALELILPVATTPEVDFSGSDIGCSDAKATDPVSYCPESNTLGVDLPSLKKRGTPMTMDSGDGLGLPVTVTGDYNAYVVFASRYTLAKQKEDGDSLTDPKTALRAACLSGHVTAVLGSPTDNPTADTFRLSPGDLDEAVSGLLTDGIAASDVNGDTVPSGFSRVDAFRTGVLGGEEACGRYA